MTLCLIFFDTASFIILIRGQTTQPIHYLSVTQGRLKNKT